MTISGLKSTLKEIEELKSQLPRPPSPEDMELMAYMASLTPEEIARAGQILIRMDNGKQPTPEDIAFILELDARPPVTLPQIDPTQLQCFICGQQPAYPRDGSEPICEPCYKSMLGSYYGR